MFYDFDFVCCHFHLYDKMNFLFKIYERRKYKWGYSHVPNSIDTSMLLTKLSLINDQKLFWIQVQKQKHFEQKTFAENISQELWPQKLWWIEGGNEWLVFFSKTREIIETYSWIIPYLFLRTDNLWGFQIWIIMNGHSSSICLETFKRWTIFLKFSKK